MSAVLYQLFNTQQRNNLISRVDTARIESFVADEQSTEISEEHISYLRVAAVASLRNAIGRDGVEGLLRAFSFEGAEDSQEFSSNWNDCFSNWVAYIESAVSSNEILSIEDLLYLSSAGLISNRLAELKILLDNNEIKQRIEQTIGNLNELTWDRFIVETICCALIKLTTQKNREDVAAADSLVESIAKKQKQFESTWLDSDPDKSSKSALLLFGLYHIAQATIRTSEYLVTGFVHEGSKGRRDFAPELRKLLIKSEEYLSAYGDLEYLYWIEPISAILWRLYNNSIWTSAYGMSELMNSFISTFSEDSRDNQIFSLLPSQKDAIKQHFLDPSIVAAVLQMPTSAGKTLLAEFSILQTLEAYGVDSRVVYLTPTRALATQIKQTLSEDFSDIGIEVTGASSAFEEDPFELNLLQNSTGVIVATPEKLDLMLRAHPEWMNTVHLVVVDEAHLLGDGERGVRLELLLANIRRDYAEAKLLLLTPFVENASEIANWLARDRGASIMVDWKPSRILLGCSSIKSKNGLKEFSIDWVEPHSLAPNPGTTLLSQGIPASKINTSRKKVNFLTNRFKNCGSVLGMFPSSPTQAEISAREISEECEVLSGNELNPYLRLAIAVAQTEYGEDSTLAECLSRGVAFHHSALSSELRYLIENQVKNGVIKYCAATTTLAQGMNFPVSSVIVHSVHLPWDRKLSPAEFWNIAGRAGRVGYSDKGMVVFANPALRSSWEKYSSSLSAPLRSALLEILDALDDGEDIKELYRTQPALRPFIQYFCHAVAIRGIDAVEADINELIEGSLANVQVGGIQGARKLRNLAQSYVQLIAEKSAGYLQLADSTGLGSFSFDELYGRVVGSNLLLEGPKEVVKKGQNGFAELIDALLWLPELDLTFDIGPGKLSPETIASIVQGWIDGKPIHELSGVYPDEDKHARVRKAGKYIFGKVSQTISWGIHAYIKAVSIANRNLEFLAEDLMLPAYVQYGVKSPEAALASILGVPRQFAEPIATEYKEKFGPLSPDKSGDFRRFISTATIENWEHIVSRSPISGKVEAEDVMTVVKKMQGI